MEEAAENFDIVFQKIAAISEETYAVIELSVQSDLDEIAELRRLAAALNDPLGISYTSS